MQKDLWTLSLKCISCRINCADNTTLVFAKKIQLESVSSKCHNITFKDMDFLSNITRNKQLVNNEYLFKRKR